MNNTLIATALLLCGGTALAATPDLIELGAEQRIAFGIQSAPVQAVTQAFSKSYPAKVMVPNAQLRVVSAPLEGVVETLLVAEGEAVDQGQTLARVRSQGLLELQADYLETRTRRGLSGETLTRDRKLHSEGIVAQRRLLESQSKYRELKTAEARDLQSLQLAGMSKAAIDALARSKQLTSVLEVKAPLNGVVLEQIATAGQRLAASDPLYRVGQLSPLWIEVHVPLNALGDLKPGDKVQLTQSQFSAVVITVGRMVHGTDQGVLVRAEISEGAETLRPGQFVEAQLSQGAGSDTLSVPAEAVVRIDGHERVFVERQNGYRVMPIEVVSREGGGVVVRSDLTLSDRVVVDGTAALKAAWDGSAE